MTDFSFGLKNEKFLNEKRDEPRVFASVPSRDFTIIVAITPKKQRVENRAKIFIILLRVLNVITQFYIQKK